MCMYACVCKSIVYRVQSTDAFSAFIEVYHACNCKVLNPCNNLCVYTLTFRVGHVQDKVEQFTVL